MRLREEGDGFWFFVIVEKRQLLSVEVEFLALLQQVQSRCNNSTTKQQQQHPT
jgi:hypothetical protein